MAGLQHARRHLCRTSPRAGVVELARRRCRGAALLKPRCHTVLDACNTFGLQAVRKEWALLAEENTREAQRARPSVERMLRNIELGFRDAEAGH